MKRRISDLLTFGGAAAAVTASAAAAHFLCPGTCVTCGSCVANLAPIAGSTIAIGAVLVRSHVTKKSGEPGSARSR
jgi:hypothetical protein